MTRLLVPLAVLALAGCENGRDFKLLGYSTRPQFDENIRTVYVPVMKSTAFEAGPNRDFEVDITKAVVREIEARTRMKVVSSRQEADTELIGVLRDIRKNAVNINQQSLIREAEIAVTVDVVWRDLRDGRILSNRRAKPSVGDNLPFDPTAPPPEIPPIPEKVMPAQIIATGRILPELGDSNATANQMIANRVATSIVNMMEMPW